jgi:D-lactate dehydrogenase
MRIAFFSAKSYDRQSFDAANAVVGHEIEYFEERLTAHTAPLAAGYPAVCAFVNDDLGPAVVEHLASCGVRLIALRCAGFNHVDLCAAQRAGVAVARVPAYSPNAVAEHTIALMLALNRKIHRAYNRVREGNFSLEGLLGFDFAGKLIGVVGTGQIGTIVTRIVTGFGCCVLAHDLRPNPECERLGALYVPLEELLRRSDVVTLHCPLTPETRHLIDARRLALMKPGVMLINTSRGALVDTRAAILALKSGRLGSLGIDVYEEESGLFFEDLSNRVILDDVFTRLLTLPNVLVTGHQAFFTAEALAAIAKVTLENVTAFETGTGTLHLVPHSA